MRLRRKLYLLRKPVMSGIRLHKGLLEVVKMAPTNAPPTSVDNPPARNAGGADAPSPDRTAWWRHLLEPKWIVLFLGLSVLLPGAVIAYSRLGVMAGREEKHGEVTLGEFRFLASRQERSPISAATFSLHLALLPETEALARARLQSHWYRVQQGVEELLRHAHGGDFEDPLLGDLKRQLQEQINAILGARVVAHAIVTDLNLEFSGIDASYPPPDEVVRSLPWTD